MGNTIILTLVFLAIFIGKHDVHAQKATFPLADTFTSAEIPIDTKVYLVPGKNNAVVVYGIDIDILDIQVIDKVLVIATIEKIHSGHILIYYDSQKSLNSPSEQEPTLLEIIKV